MRLCVLCFALIALAAIYAEAPAQQAKPDLPTGQAGQLTIKHQEMLYPAVRVTIGQGGGSGTILYSEDRGDGCQTFVLTNHHVVDGAIKVAEQWSSLLQADVKRENNDTVQVEIFRYGDGSRQDITDSCRGEIAAHDKTHDIALLKLQTSQKFAYAAKLLPESVQPAIFERIYAVGAALLHPPTATEGVLNYLDDIIDQKSYWMGSANIIFGNSGGAVYLEREGHYWFIGIPSRVAVVGFGSPVTHMGYFIPITRLREWLRHEELTFLLDAKQKPSECFSNRSELRKKAELQMLKSLKPGAGTVAPHVAP